MPKASNARFNRIAEITKAINSSAAAADDHVYKMSTLYLRHLEHWISSGGDVPFSPNMPLKEVIPQKKAQKGEGMQDLRFDNRPGIGHRARSSNCPSAPASRADES